MSYQRMSIWARDFCEALADLGQRPVPVHLVQSLYEEGYSPEEAARWVAAERGDLEDEAA